MRWGSLFRDLGTCEYALRNDRRVCSVCSASFALPQVSVLLSTAIELNSMKTAGVMESVAPVCLVGVGDFCCLHNSVSAC